MTQENLNNLENNEIPKINHEKVAEKEISQEDFLNWLDNEGNMFKNETTDEMNKANSIDLDQSTFEKVKNETEVEQELNTINQETEKVISEAKSELSNEAMENISPELQHELNNLKFLNEEKPRRQAYLEKLRNDFKEQAPYLSVSEKDYRDKQINKVEFEIQHTIPDKIKEINKKIEEMKNPTEQKVEASIEKPKIETLIQNASELSELYKILKEAGGIQGSEKFYATDEVWQAVNAFVNNKAEKTVITRTGGLREKVKELKRLREEKSQKQTSQNIEQSNETKENLIKQVSMEEWKRTLPDVHAMAEFSFRDFNPTYYLDDKGDHYVIYTEDGKRQGRKLYVAAQNAGMSVNVEPSEIEKR